MAGLDTSILRDVPTVTCTAELNTDVHGFRCGEPVGHYPVTKHRDTETQFEWTDQDAAKMAEYVSARTGTIK